MKRHFPGLLFLLIFISSPCFALSLPTSVQSNEILSEKPTEIKAGKKGLVVIFMSAVCPCSESHKEIIKKLAADFKDFNFVGVHSNADELPDPSKKYFKESNFPFPVLQDDHFKWADQFKALKTPHAFVISPEGNLLYQGGVTNSSVGPTADKQFLRDALAEVDTGKGVSVSRGRTLGCIISRGEKNVW